MKMLARNKTGLERWAWMDRLRLPHRLWKRLDIFSWRRGWKDLSDYAGYRAHVG